MNFTSSKNLLYFSLAMAFIPAAMAAEPGAVDDYLHFLKSGSAAYPLELLKNAGVDLTSPEPVEETFALMGDYVDRLEKLLEIEGKIILY